MEQQGLPLPYYHLRVTPSKRVLKPLPEAQVIYVLVEITPDMRYARDEQREVPLNLALVIDRSTSMRGPRLERVKQAVHRIIETFRGKPLAVGGVTVPKTIVGIPLDVQPQPVIVPKVSIGASYASQSRGMW